MLCHFNIQIVLFALYIQSGLSLPFEPPFGILVARQPLQANTVLEPLNATTQPWKRADGGFPCFVRNFLCCWTCCPPDSPPPRPIELRPNPSTNNPAWTCTGEVPSLDELRYHAIRLRDIEVKTSIFYTKLVKGRAVEAAACWFDEYEEGVKRGDMAHFNNILDDDYYFAVASAIKKMPNADRNIDRFQKLLSQAFAETSSGRVFVFMPSDSDVAGSAYDDMNVWKNWEYPALTRNVRVEEIRRVDPRVDQQSQQAWRKGDGPSEREPTGTNWPPGLAD
ncbi:hypothetical protein BDZ85DRAFT_131677 [Elsinoe ampelina]|uniref:Uncharacterized protein n=1 Tax=Elsinoe ampelina TaxID=302913 RepID=A0A6A6GAI5_9PEZI|nr:hypothetical protein BDZ85DRAFT_131677 [Elsinoe ampelina]